MEDFLIRTSRYQSKVVYKEPHSRVVERVHHHRVPCREVDIHGDYWTLAFFTLPEGSGFLIHAGGAEPLVGDQALFVPPRALLHWEILKSDLRWKYLMVEHEGSLDGLPTPLLFSVQSLGLCPDDLSVRASAEILAAICQRAGDATPIHVKARACSHAFKQAIDARFREPLALQTLLGETPLNFSYLSRQFKKDFAISPVRYRNQLRMIQASVEMLFAHSTVEEAKWQMGLEDSTYFYESFRKLLLINPSAFRAPSAHNDKRNGDD
jgi:AraC-like DNA-binding protein